MGLEKPKSESKIRPDKCCPAKSNEKEGRGAQKPVGPAQHDVIWQTQEAHATIMQEMRENLNCVRIKTVKQHQVIAAENAWERKTKHKKGTEWNSQSPMNL